MELKILASVISAREHWNSVHPHYTEDELSPEGIVVWNSICDYYKRDTNAESVDKELLASRILRRYQDNVKHRELMHVYLQRLDLVDVSSVNVVSEVLANKKDVISLQLADALVSKNVTRSRELIDKLQVLDLATDLNTGVEEEYQGEAIANILKSYSTDNIIRIAPTSLNSRIGGGAMRGHHILLAAMPETGKSLFALNMAHGFVTQKLKVLYIGNEDPVVSLVMRFIGNLTGMSKADIVESPHKAQKLAEKRGYDRIVFAGLSPGSLPEIRSLIHKHSPDVLIVDQLRNIHVKSENRTGELEAVARGMRDFARQYDMLVVSVTQAGDSARDRLTLNMGDIDGSNIGMPGACDVMVMVGMNEAYYKNDERHVTLAKNKLTGEHSDWIVRIDKATSRVTDPSDFRKNEVKVL